LIAGRKVSTEDVASAALASTFNNIFFIAVQYGLGTGIDTLAAQWVGKMGLLSPNGSLNGSFSLTRHNPRFQPRNQPAIDITPLRALYHRTFLICMAVFTPIAFIHIFATPILLALHQPVEIAEKTGRYLRLLVPFLPGSIIYVQFTVKTDK
jgi:Na+-driven multidrug efflux pump